MDALGVRFSYVSPKLLAFRAAGNAAAEATDSAATATDPDARRVSLRSIVCSLGSACSRDHCERCRGERSEGGVMGPTLRLTRGEPSGGASTASDTDAAWSTGLAVVGARSR